MHKPPENSEAEFLEFDVDELLKRHEKLKSQLHSLKESFEKQIKMTLILEIFARFLDIDCLLLKQSKTRTETDVNSAYQESLKLLNQRFPVEMSYIGGFLENNYKDYGARYTQQVANSAFSSKAKVLQNFRSKFNSESVLLMEEGLGNLGDEAIKKNLFESFVQNLYLSRSFSGLLNDEEEQETIKRASGFAYILQSSLSQPALNAQYCLLLFRTLQNLPAVGVIEDPKDRKLFINAYNQICSAMKSLLPYSRAVFCYHVATFCQNFPMFSDDVLEENTDVLAIEWQKKMRVYAAEVTDTSVASLLELLSINRPLKVHKKNSFKVDAFKTWFLQTKREFYRERVVDRIKKLKLDVVKNKWADLTDSYFVDILPDPRYLIGIVLHIFQQQLSDNICYINENIQRYAKADPESESYKLYEAILTWKKDCLEAIKEINKIRAVYYFKILDLGLQQTKPHFQNWLENLTNVTDSLIADTKKELSKIKDTQSSNRRICDERQLKKYNELLLRTLAESPVHKKFKQVQAKKRGTLKKDFTQQESQAKTKPGKVDKKNKPSTFDIGFAFINEGQFDKAKKYYLDAAMKATDLFVQAVLFYQYAETHELEIENLLTQNVDTKIEDLRQEAVEYYKRARNNLLCIRLESSNEGVETWLGFIDEKLDGVVDDATENTKLDEQIVDSPLICRQKLVSELESNRYKEMHETLKRGSSVAAIKVLREHQRLDTFFPGTEMILIDYSKESFRNFINGALEYYDSRMKIVHRTGILSGISMEFCFAVLLWPAFKKNISKVEPPNNSSFKVWYEEFCNCITKALESSSLNGGMPQAVKHYIGGVWTSFYLKQYNLGDIGPRLSHVCLRDAEIFTDFYVFRQALADRVTFESTNPAKTSVGFYGSTSVTQDQTKSEQSTDVSTTCALK